MGCAETEAPINAAPGAIGRLSRFRPRAVPYEVWHRSGVGACCTVAVNVDGRLTGLPKLLSTAARGLFRQSRDGDPVNWSVFVRRHLRRLSSHDTTSTLPPHDSVCARPCCLHTHRTAPSRTPSSPFCSTHHVWPLLSKLTISFNSQLVAGQHRPR